MEERCVRCDIELFSGEELLCIECEAWAAEPDFAPDPEALATQLAAARERIKELEAENARLVKLLKMLRKAAFQFIGLRVPYETADLHAAQDAWVDAMHATLEYAHNRADSKG
jgi:hypothetical protein